MMILVLGENSSGKSAYAERVAAALCQGDLYYIATMLPYGSDGEQRVKRHREQRKGMGFITVEAPFGEAEPSHTDTVLLEDVSNLLANLMFDKKTPDGKNLALKQVERLLESCQNLVVVSISGFAASDGNDAQTIAYIEALNALNILMAERADAVVEMVSGLPVMRKGTIRCLS